MTGNAIVGVPIGGTHGASIRPYVVGGVGLIRTNVQDAAALFDVNTKNDFGFDVGGGVMGFFSTNVGLRGDVRYFRGFSGTSDNIAGLSSATSTSGAAHSACRSSSDRDAGPDGTSMPAGGPAYISNPTPG